MSSLGRSTPPRDPCITLPAVITARGTACSLPSMTSAMSSLYAVKLSLVSLSYQTCASRYFSFGPSSAPAHLRTRLSAAAPSHSRSRSAIGRSWKEVTLIGTPSSRTENGSYYDKVPAGVSGIRQDQGLISCHQAHEPSLRLRTLRRQTTAVAPRPMSFPRSDHRAAPIAAE